MGTINLIKALIFLLVLSSCSLLRTGYTNEYQQYVPKKPKFKLKDKKGFVIPLNLDTINIYRLKKTYLNGVLHPLPSDSFSELNKVRMYKKFYSNGRGLNFSIPVKDNLGNLRSLANSDLATNNPYYSKCYYYSQGTNKLQEERFVYAEGDGRYIIGEYTLSFQGDTLELNAKDTREIYIKEIIPTNWIKYYANW